MSPRTAVFSLILSASLATTGCTVAGTAIGASMPSYERTEWPAGSLQLGDEVRVHIRTVGVDSTSRTEIAGRYGGIREGLMSVTDEAGREHEIAVRDILDVDVRRGTQWKKGLLLGAAADAVAIATTIAIVRGADVSIATATSR